MRASPPGPCGRRNLRIGLVYNGITPDMLLQEPLDRTAELDCRQTIVALRDAILGLGHDVVPIEADEDAYERLRGSGVGLVFNIAEGVRGEDREAQIPAMLEMLGIPYAGSGPLTLALCLNKARTKEILSCHGVPTPAFQVWTHSEEALSDCLAYPLIVKLLHEGSSMGLSYDSVVESEQALRRRVRYLRETYDQPALVEQFIDGREFTVPVTGNSPPQALPAIEVVFRGPRPITLFQPDDAVIRMLARARGDRLVACEPVRLSDDRRFALLQTEAGREMEVPVTLSQSICPAPMSRSLAESVRATALKAYRALECRDWCRIDMRVGADQVPQVLELNPIAGIDSSYWFPRSAMAAGMTYAELIGVIIDAARQRYRI